MVSHSDYSTELAAAYPDFGHPLADPQPGFDETGQPLPRIEIGDVGYIESHNGTFVRFFNVHKSPGTDGQPRPADLPEGFAALEHNISPCRLNRSMQYFTSKSVLVLGAESGLSAPVISPVEGTIKFKLTRERGAILVTPGPSPLVSGDASPLTIKHYRLYAIAHMKSWIAFFKEQGLCPEDIVFVTGFHRTMSWATAAFAGSSTEATVDLSVKFANVGGLHAAAQYNWQRNSAALMNSFTPTAIGNNGFDVEPNQTIFIRRFIIRRAFWGMHMKAGAEPRDLDVGKDEDPACAVSIEEQPKPSQAIDTLTPVLDFVLTNSGAQIALVHDSDLALYNDIIQGKGEDLSLYIEVSGDGSDMSPAIATMNHDIEEDTLQQQDAYAPEDVNMNNYSCDSAALPTSIDGFDELPRRVDAGVASGAGVRPDSTTKEQLMEGIEGSMPLFHSASPTAQAFDKAAMMYPIDELEVSGSTPPSSGGLPMSNKSLNRVRAMSSDTFSASSVSSSSRPSTALTTPWSSPSFPPAMPPSSSSTKSSKSAEIHRQQANNPTGASVSVAGHGDAPLAAADSEHWHQWKLGS